MPLRSPATADRILVILNAHSGNQQKMQVAELLHSTAKRIGMAVDVRIVHGHEIREVVRRAREQGYSSVIVGGGDGSINAAVAELAGSDIRFGVLPLGTFNYFARQIGLPQDDLEQSLRLCLTSECTEVAVGEVNGHTFLNNASIGLYPEVIAIREQTYRRWGRSRLAGYWSVLLAIMRRHVNLRLSVTVDGKQRQMRTPFIFVARNAYQLKEYALPGTTCIANDAMTIFVLPPVGRVALVRLAWRMLRRRVKPREDDVTVWCGNSIIVDSLKTNRRVRLVLDGEVVHSGFPLHFKVQQSALRVITPLQTAA